jgi:hypothetical protein
MTRRGSLAPHRHPAATASRHDWQGADTKVVAAV